MNETSGLITTVQTSGCGLNIILFEPEIPPNTGNIMRLAANTGAKLHLVGPLGFVLDDTRLTRAGLDYRDKATVRHHESWHQFRQTHPDMRLWAFTTRASMRHDEASFQPGDGLLFGPETSGLPQRLLDELGASRCPRLPMIAESRSMNLSNAVAAGVYEAWRQVGY
jgi:tRNA (cytidine(34)-2'-O)-methyltransferase